MERNKRPRGNIIFFQFFFFNKLFDFGHSNRTELKIARNNVEIDSDTRSTE